MDKYLVRDLENGNIYMHYDGPLALPTATAYAAECALSNKTPA